MQIHLSIPLLGGWLVLALLAQTGLDMLYTRKILIMASTRKALLLLGASTLALAILGTGLRFAYPSLQGFLRWARDDSGTLGIWVLVLVAGYAVLGFLFALLRAGMVSLAVLDEVSREKRQAWWSYAVVGSVAMVLLAAPVFFIYLLLPAVLGG